MAIYNNREVYVLGPTPMSTTPEVITVRYKDGSQENVPLMNVKFTEDERRLLLKTYPSKFDLVTVVTEDDLKAVRQGLAPEEKPEVKSEVKPEVKSSFFGKAKK